MRAQGWAEAEKAKAQRKPAAMREHEQIFGQAPKFSFRRFGGRSRAARRVKFPRRIDREEVLEAGSSVEVSLTLFG